MSKFVPVESKMAEISSRSLILTQLTALVEPLGKIFPGNVEVVLHDLSLLPSSIVAVYGNLTNRQVGDPATDLLLEQSYSGFKTSIGYDTHLEDGTRLRSSTIIVRDLGGEPIAALCFNVDVSIWKSVEMIALQMQGAFDPPKDGEVPVAPPPPAPTKGKPVETFPSNIDELSSHLLQEAIRQVGVPLEKMKKEHKLDVVRRVRAKGYFQIREAAEHVADALSVSRFTIYNYLNEIIAAEDEPDDPLVVDGALARKGS